MSLVSQSGRMSAPLRASTRPLFVSAAVAAALLLLGGNLAGNGAFAPSLALDGMLLHWQQGSLLQVFVGWVASWFGFAVDQRTALALGYVAIAATGAGVLYRQLRASDWPMAQAALAIILVYCQAMLLQMVTSVGPEFLIVITAFTLIPVWRGLAAVGDTQSVVNYGLILPLLLLSGPALAALVPLLVLAVPFSEPEARRRPRVFMAMLLVGIVPTLIVVLGVTVVAVRAGIGLDEFVAPLLRAFRPGRWPFAAPIILMLLSAPIGLAALLHAFIPDRRRQVLTSALVLLVPLYLALGNSFLSFNLALWTPAVALLATSLGWLGATRVRPWMRWLVLALLLAGAAASWWLAPVWAAPAWLEGLLPFQLFGLTFG